MRPRHILRHKAAGRFWVINPSANGPLEVPGQDGRKILTRFQGNRPPVAADTWKGLTSSRR